MAGKELERFEIRRFGSALTKHLGEIEQVNVVLQNKIGKTIHRQCTGVQLMKKRVFLDGSPNTLTATP
jgi:hypothetical protein